MINITNKPEGHRWLELGCGKNPHPQCDVHVDVRPIDGVTHFTVDMDKGLPEIGDNDFEGVVSIFAFEHVAWGNLKNLLKECLRILKPGGRLVIVVPNTEAQIEWIRRNPDGWDGKGFFEAASEKLFGTGEYEANNHKSYWNPALAQGLFRDAGFVDIITAPAGERKTDMVVDAKKPATPTLNGFPVVKNPDLKNPFTEPIILGVPPVVPSDPASLFDRHYFDGGTKVGGYRPPGYADYPCHWSTFQHIMQRRPHDVVELGASRGYVGKRLEDTKPTFAYQGMDVSKHCQLTKVTDHVLQWDLCKTPWPVTHFIDHNNTPFQVSDLCFSINFLQYIPEESLPAVIAEMQRICKRGLHGISFDAGDGFDKCVRTVKGKDWWEAMFAKHAPGWPVEIMEASALERPCLANDVPPSDGKVKAHLGCFTNMFHQGWMNVDQHDLQQHAQQYGYQYARHDLKSGVPVQTGMCDLIFAHHVFEHFSYRDGLSLLRDARRAIKPTGGMRIVVPDSGALTAAYQLDWQYGYSNASDLNDFHTPILKLQDLDEINHEAAAAPTEMMRLYELMITGHLAMYDWNTLRHLLNEAGFDAKLASFRKSEYPQTEQILKETTEMAFGGLSMFVDAVPIVD